MINNRIEMLRFKDDNGNDYPEWEEKTLGEIGVFLGGGTPSTKNVDFWNGSIPWVSSSDLKDGSIYQINATRFITDNAVKQSATKLIPKKSILIVSRVGVGKIAVNEVDICTSQDFTNLTLYSDNYIFIAYLLKIKTNKLLEFNQGTSIKGFVKSDLEELKINLPCLEEQQKIAGFLSSIDEKIEKLEQELKQLKEYKKGVMQQLFDPEGFNIDGGGVKSLTINELRGFIRFKDDNGNEYPNWEKKILGEIGETYNGLTGKSKENFGIGKPYIQYKQIFDDSKIDISRFELVEISSTEKQNKVLFGDVFFTVSSETPNEIGMSSVLLEEIEELYLNSFCFGYRANSLKTLSPYFSKYLFRSELFRNDIVKLAQGSTRYNMSKIQLMKLEVKLPCLEEQTKIANFLSDIDEKINKVVVQFETTKEFKKGVMQQMFV